MPITFDINHWNQQIIRKYELTGLHREFDLFLEQSAI